MAARATAFQQATVDAAVAALTDAAGSGRFLIADETGLGKTVVACGVIDRLRAIKRSRGRPFRICYITSGQRIAHQNRSRLIEFLPEAQIKQAIVKADRLCLVPMEQQDPRHDLKLFAVTPYTSFPDKKKRQGTGRKDERAFMAALLNRIVPGLSGRLPSGLMQGRVSDATWEAQRIVARGQARAADARLLVRFRSSLRNEFGSWLEEKLVAAAREAKPTSFIARLRHCLSLAVLQAIPPDIVVLDEFQKFRDLLAGCDQDNLLKTLFCGFAGRRPAVLLLSATPYRTYASRWEEEDDAAHVQLFELIEFLGGDESGPQLRSDAERLFHEFGHRLHQIPRLEQDRERQLAIVAQARHWKSELETLLTRLMSRTERALIVAMEHGDPAIEEATIPLEAPLAPSDVAAYRHLVDSFDQEDRADAVAYWLSVPLAAQALGRRYQAWIRATHSSGRGVTKITKTALAKPQASADWAHPKLRALKQVAPARSLITPWVHPSLPWWPLQGAWADTSTSPKMLLFGRFRATPQSVAALTSLAVEAHAVNRGDDAVAKRARRRFRVRTAQMPVFALFHPSPFLTEYVDPLVGAPSTMEDVRKSVRQQIVEAIKGALPVRRATKKERTRKRPTWIVLANIERRLWKDGSASAAWLDIPEVHTMLAQWRQAPALDWISPRELKELVDSAISSPAIACARALRRQLDAPFTATDRVELVRLCWRGFRTYFDEPVFYARAPRKESSADTIRRMVVEGCLESVLDEHFWMKTRSGSRSASALIADLLDALRLNAGAFTFRSLPNTKQGLRVRCHAAVPFGGTDDENYKDASRPSDKADVPARADEIREAFNTPFWPHMVATTSVGQEGLDFHTWCDRVAHWDLCPSPVELEQREGRVHRFAGLMVRKKISEELGGQALRGTQRLQSPWIKLASLAADRFPGGSGMSPWWQLGGATIHRYVFRLPMSRDIERFKTLQEQRLIYRLALGQPNSEDLVASLATGSEETRRLLQSLVLNLSAYARKSSAAATNPCPEAVGHCSPLLAESGSPSWSVPTH